MCPSEGNSVSPRQSANCARVGLCNTAPPGHIASGSFSGSRSARDKPVSSISALRPSIRTTLTGCEFRWRNRSSSSMPPVNLSPTSVTAPWLLSTRPSRRRMNARMTMFPMSGSAVNNLANRSLGTRITLGWGPSGSSDTTRPLTRILRSLNRSSSPVNPRSW